jgi:hypothetical protein
VNRTLRHVLLLIALISLFAWPLAMTNVVADDGGASVQESVVPENDDGDFISQDEGAATPDDEGSSLDDEGGGALDADEDADSEEEADSDGDEADADQEDEESGDQTPDEEGEEVLPDEEGEASDEDTSSDRDGDPVDDEDETVSDEGDVDEDADSDDSGDLTPDEESDPVVEKEDVTAAGEDDPADDDEDLMHYPLGLIPSEGEFEPYEPPAVLLGGSLPSRVDFSHLLPPVGSQGGQASCVAWTLAYSYRTLQERRARGWNVTLPQYQFSPAWVYNQRSTSDCSADGGMSYVDGLNILRDKGAATMAAFPYNPNDSCKQPSQSVKKAAAQYRIKSYSNVFLGAGNANLNTLKSLVAGGEPIAIAIPVHTSYYSVTYTNPVVPRPKPGETFYGGHAMLIVGYDDSIGGFLAVNSWGTGWGRNGYGYLSYDFVRYDAWEAWIMEPEPIALGKATYSGSVQASGINPNAQLQSSSDVRVTAWIDGVQVASTTATQNGSRLTYSLVVPEDNPQTPARDGGVEGDVVHFKVGSYWAEGSATWRRNATISHNLQPLTYRSHVALVTRNKS